LTGSASRRRLATILSLASALAVLATAAPASAEIAPTRDAAAIAQAIGDPLSPGILTGADFTIIPPVPSDVRECSDDDDNDFDGLTDFPDDPGCSSATDNQEQDDAPPECADEFDNDGDEKVDFGEDPGCTSATDLDEGSEGPSITPECSDGIDNDFDDKTDFAGGDPGCSNATDNLEEDERLPQCSNQDDDDFDDLIDFPADSGCLNTLDDEEENGVPNPQAECSDGFDNDGDGDTDHAGGDLGCSSATDLDEFSEGEHLPSSPECSDGEDNDFDDLTDFAPGSAGDPGCSSAADNLELDDAGPACSDGDDNDGDGADDEDDPGCDSSGDNDESSEGLPPGEDPNPTATSNSALTGFPFSGGTFAILTSGNSTFADDANTSGSTGQGNNGDDGGHGATFADVVTLRVILSVPANSNCLSVDFSFLSDEFPEYVGNRFNDAFIAELDESNFSADAAQSNKIIAPNNFAFDGQGNVISVNTTGATEMSAAEATGTTYDGATPRLRAAVPVTPGMHAVFFSIFDQGDDAYDSAVFLDNLAVFSAPAGACKAGATPDVTPPDTTITAGPAEGSSTNDNTPTFEFTSTEAGSTFQCAIDGGAFASCDTPHTTAALTPGPHTFSVRAIDPAGNVDPSPASRTFTVTGGDTTPPDTAITAGPAAGSTTNDNTPTFEFTSNEAGSTFECRIDTGAFAACSPPHTTAALPDGQHTFEVRAKDAAGNIDPTPASRTFTVDTTPPDTTITSGPTGPTTDSTPTFTFTSTEAGSTFECRVDGGTFAACSSPYTTSVLSDGQHTIEVRAKDTAGNTDPTPASRTFTVDTTPPDTTITSGPAQGSTTNDNTPTFEFTSPDSGATFECRIDSGTFAACNSPHTTATLANGQHTIEVRAKDTAGNVDPTPASRTFIVVDDTPPDTTIASGPAGLTNDSTPTFTFSATEAGSPFECRIDGGTFSSCSSPHTTAALTDGQHTIEVRAKDTAGNTDPTPASRTFTVDATPPDTTITSGPAGPTNDNTPTFGFTSTEAGSTFECRIDNGPFAPCNSPHTAAALSDGQHTFAVRAKDPAGNTDPTPASRTFTVSTVQPPPPPPPPPPGPKCNGVAATIVGTAGKDKIRGTNGRDVIVALGGKDKISGRGGNDLICAGGGDDKVDAGSGDDVVFGEGGRDHLRGGDGDDRLDGGDGDDKLRGGAGNDRARGGDGKDMVDGDSGHDRLAGEGQRDSLSGASGNDRLNGGGDRDRCRGGGGQNVLLSCER
jgi:hypothetical protein